MIDQWSFMNTNFRNALKETKNLKNSKKKSVKKYKETDWLRNSRLRKNSNRLIGKISNQHSANVGTTERNNALYHATEIFDLARDAASLRRWWGNERPEVTSDGLWVRATPMRTNHSVESHRGRQSRYHTVHAAHACPKKKRWSSVGELLENSC